MILRGLGRPGAAESLLLAARDGFLAEGIPYDTALVSLEIATLYAGQGRTAELKRWRPRWCRSSPRSTSTRRRWLPWPFLTQAFESEAAGLEILTAVTNYLRRAPRTSRRCVFRRRNRRKDLGADASRFDPILAARTRF